MRGQRKHLGLLSLVLMTGLACHRAPAFPQQGSLPAGTAMLQFSMRVQGPLELTIDGTRVPVRKVAKKTGWRLSVDGLGQGPHRFLLMSPREAFGPDQFELTLGPSRGEFKYLFAQKIQADLYGTPDSGPSAEAIPGVTASLLP